MLTVINRETVLHTVFYLPVKISHIISVARILHKGEQQGSEVTYLVVRALTLPSETAVTHQLLKFILIYISTYKISALDMLTKHILSIVMLT